MSIEDRVQHIVNLITLRDYLRGIGGEASEWLTKELNTCHADLDAALKEKHSEQHEEGTADGGDQPRRGVTDRDCTSDGSEA